MRNRKNNFMSTQPDQPSAKMRDDETVHHLADAVRAACIAAALDGYEMAAISGLCPEGAWEAAVSAMQRLDLTALLDQMAVGDQNSSR